MKSIGKKVKNVARKRVKKTVEKQPVFEGQYLSLSQQDLEHGEFSAVSRWYTAVDAEIETTSYVETGGNAQYIYKLYKVIQPLPIKYGSKILIKNVEVKRD